MARPTAQELAEIGKATQIKPGEVRNPMGKNGRVVLDPFIAMMKAEEEAIAKQWMADLKDDTNPVLRHAVRRDAMDRANGKPAQSIHVSTDPPEDTQIEAVDSW